MAAHTHSLCPRAVLLPTHLPIIILPLLRLNTTAQELEKLREDILAQLAQVRESRASIFSNAVLPNDSTEQRQFIAQRQLLKTKADEAEAKLLVRLSVSQRATAFGTDLLWRCCVSLCPPVYVPALCVRCGCAVYALRMLGCLRCGCPVSALCRRWSAPLRLSFRATRLPATPSNPSLFLFSVLLWLLLMMLLPLLLLLLVVWVGGVGGVGGGVCWGDSLPWCCRPSWRTWRAWRTLPRCKCARWPRPCCCTSPATCGPQ